MSTLTIERARVDETGSTRLPGLLCLWAGVLGVASGVFLAVVPPAVDDDRYSYPLTAGGFVLIQCWFVLQHLGLAAGLIGLRRSAAVGARRVGITAAIVGMGLLTATELAAIGAARSTYPGPGTGLLDALYGVSSVAIGAGLVGAGVAVLRAGVWRGWRRWLPLVLGVYVFVPMFPAMFGGFLTARFAISGWMLLFALLGWALAREDLAESLGGGHGSALNERASAGWRRPFLWVFTLGSLTVALGVLWQAFTIVAFVRGAGDRARDLHVLGAYVVHTVEIVVFLAALGAFWSDWKRVSIASMFPVVGTVQVFTIGDTDVSGGWVNGLHGLLALGMLLWAAWLTGLGVRALRRA